MSIEVSFKHIKIEVGVQINKYDFIFFILLN